MSNHALLLRMNPESLPRWNSQVAVYGHADVWLVTRQLQLSDVPLNTPVVVLAVDGRGIVAWGKTTGAVESREDASWMDSPAQHRPNRRESKTRVYARLRCVCVPLSAVQERLTLAVVLEMASESITWLTVEQYRDVCELCGKAPKMESSAVRRSIASPSSPTPHDVPDAKIAEPFAFENLLAGLSLRSRGILRQLKVENAVALKSVTKTQIRECPGWNWKKVREITAAQAKLLIQERQERYSSAISAISFDHTPGEVFDAIWGMLDVRSVHLLEKLAVDNLEKFMRLDREILLKQRNAGRKTADRITEIQYQIAEFVQAQAQMGGGFRSESLLQAPFIVGKIQNQATCGGDNMNLSYANAPTEVMDAIRGNLSLRANHTLASLGIGNLKSFMKVDRDKLMTQRHCGRKSADMILRLQSAISDFSRAQIQVAGSFSPEQLLAAPCLVGGMTDGQNMASVEGVRADPENPVPWLVSWVQELARSERVARVFMLRMGMLGDAPKTLESIGQEFGVTRERVRQMQVKVEKKAGTQYQQFRLRPLAEAVAAVVVQRGGMVELTDLTRAVLGKGKDGEQLAQATPLMLFFSKLAVWKAVGLRPVAGGRICAKGFVMPPEGTIGDLPLWQASERKQRHRAGIARARFATVATFDPNDLTI